MHIMHSFCRQRVLKLFSEKRFSVQRNAHLFGKESWPFVRDHHLVFLANS